MTDRRAFLAYLESLRGLAALSVALFHSFHMLPVDGIRVYDRALWSLSTLDQIVIRLVTSVFNGGAAVSLFFVLSGFVLQLSLHADDRPELPRALRFGWRRFCRIYPPLALNIILMALVLSMVAGSGLQGVPSPSAQDVLTNLLLQDFPVNGATWSLQVEMAAIPFIFIYSLVSRRWGARGLQWGLVFAFVFMFTPLNLKMRIGPFLFMFVLGMVVAHSHVIGKAITAKQATRLLSLSLATLLGARLVLGYHSKYGLLLEGLGAGGLIAALVLGPSGRIHAALHRPSVRFLGRISYSFYLYHPLALTVLVPMLTAAAGTFFVAHPVLGSTLIACATIPPAVCLGWLSYTLVELPCVRLGHLRFIPRTSWKPAD